MWFFGSESFLSVVQHRQNPDILIVRSRRPGHIQKMFPKANVETIDGRDYQFRAELPREVVAQRMHQYVMEMTATNFKDSVKDKIYHDACFKVWGCMERIQPLPAYSLYSNKKGKSAFDGPLFGGNYSFDHRPASTAKKGKKR
ncbi:hypothetical protein MF451_003784 [Salmonella enterica subsp. enterica serovar Saintpaul]|nr:hypothetical protein [Salmonella enterica subsp. enterica serovar Saintpaul]